MSETEFRADVKRPYGQEHAKISGQSIREQRKQEVVALSAELIVDICLETNLEKRGYNMGQKIWRAGEGAGLIWATVRI